MVHTAFYAITLIEVDFDHELPPMILQYVDFELQYAKVRVL